MGAEEQPGEETSDHLLVARRLAGAAAADARARGLDPGSEETHGLLEQASEIAETLAWAYYLRTRPNLTPERKAECNDFEVRQRWRMTSIHEPGSLEASVAEHGELPVAREELEHGVTLYLRSPWRDEVVDGILVRALADMEITAFLEFQVRPDILTGKAWVAEMRRSWALDWWVGRFRSLGVGIVMVAILVALAILWPSMPEWAFVGGLLLVAVMVVGSAVLGAVILFVVGPEVKARHRRTLDIVDAMKTFYIESRPGGPVSVPFLRRRVEELRQLGVIWPGTLWALLDDLDQRSVTVL